MMSYKYTKNNNEFNMPKKINTEEILKESSMRVNEADQRAAIAKRGEIISKMTGIEIKNIQSFSIDPEKIENRNIECFVGAIQTPVTFAGPILVNDRMHYVAISTNEGALAMSINRGMKAVNMSGGVNARVTRDHMTRSVSFELNDMNNAEKFESWVLENYNKIKEAIETDSSHLEITKMNTTSYGSQIFLKFFAKTGDANGMNMLTIGVDKGLKYISANYEGANPLTLSANMCSDKKSTAINIIEGRGKSVDVEVVIPEEILNNVMKTTATALENTYNSKIVMGSSFAVGMGNYNAHAANIVAATFLATGQDAAQIVESSAAFTSIRKVGDNGNDIKMTVQLPSLEIGTIGGGTAIETQNEAIQVMLTNLYNKKRPESHSAMIFAEIIGAAVLAGELNLLCALSSHDLASGHKNANQAAKKCIAELKRDN
jgi:hydroxymethylglutaryl-CoA reductase (NADPH)